MRQSRTFVLACAVAAGFAGTARAGAPQPDTRAGEFAHVCQGGSNKGQPCTRDTDCPGSACVVQPLSNTVKGTLTIIAHDSVTDWANGGATNQALTVMLEVKSPDGVKQMLAATYQDLAQPTNAPQALSNVVAIGMDEFAVQTLSAALNGLLFVQPEATLAAQLQALYGSTGIPAIVVVDRKAQSADHTGDGLATVLRFKVKVQFLEPI